MTSKKMKTMSLFFILLMFGSTFAYAILSSFTGQNEEIQIPQEKILNYELDEQQRSYLRSRGYTLIEYSYSTGCLECIDVKNKLERITQDSEGQIYLQELTIVGSSSKLTVTSLNGQKILNNPSVEEIETTVCDFLMKRPLWCVTSKI